MPESILPSRDAVCCVQASKYPVRVRFCQRYGQEKWVPESSQDAYVGCPIDKLGDMHETPLIAVLREREKLFELDCHLGIRRLRTYCWSIVEGPCGKASRAE